MGISGKAKKIDREMEDNRRHGRSNVDLRSCETNYYLRDGERCYLKVDEK